MFELPSIWNLIFSTIVFFVAVKYLHSFLEKQGLPKGMTRGTLVFILASLISWGSGEVVDWSEAKITGKQVASQSSDDLTQLLKLVDQVQSSTQDLKEPYANQQ